MDKFILRFNYEYRSVKDKGWLLMPKVIILGHYDVFRRAKLLNFGFYASTKGTMIETIQLGVGSEFTKNSHMAVIGDVEPLYKKHNQLWNLSRLRCFAHWRRF